MQVVKTDPYLQRAGPALCHLLQVLLVQLLLAVLLHVQQAEQQEQLLLLVQQHLLSRSNQAVRMWC